MTKLNAPPQAYTRETLAQAYIWLKSQPDLIKDRAKNADSLVSLYLHACRHGLDVFKDETSSSEAPRSSQNFRNTLKDLSEGFRQFEEAEESVPSNVSHLSVATATAVKQRPEKSQQTPHNESFEQNHPPHRPSTPPPQAREHFDKVEASQPEDRRRRNQNHSPPPYQQQEPPLSSRDPFPIYRSYLPEDEWARSGTSVALDPPFPPFANAASELTLDSRSHEILRRVRRKMNLS
ncbi:MAG: hypothetical protein KDD35_11870, partial [Bdellovibrionales bacterium]|nr:hypothetical protein [Bdellovibrionales bacterium]